MTSHTRRGAALLALAATGLALSGCTPGADDASAASFAL